MKRLLLLLFLLLSILLLNGALASPGTAPDWGEPEGELYEAEFDGISYEYTLNENGEATITGYGRIDELCEKQDAVIPSELDGHPVTGIGHDAFGHYEGFNYCKVKSLHIPAGITYMGVNPFRGWFTLETVTVDAANPRFEVADGALYDKVDRRLVFCPLTIRGSFTVKEGTRIIGAMAFGEWDGWGSSGSPIEQIFLPDSVEEIGDYAFSMSSIASVILPSSLKSVGYCAFSYTPLNEVTFNDGLESIGEYAFEYTDLTSVTLPDSLTYISKDAFACCDDLIEINASERVKEMLRVRPEDYVLYQLDADGDATVTGFRFVPDEETLVIPNTLEGHPVTAIGDDAFAYMSNRAWNWQHPLRVQLPASIAEIVQNPFKNCTSYMLTEIVVDPANERYESVDGVLYDKREHVLVACLHGRLEDRTTVVQEGTLAIGEYAFGTEDSWGVHRDGELTVILPESLREIRQGAFARCKIDVIEIPCGVKAISPYAFEDAYIYHLMLDEGIETIGFRAFYDCYIIFKVILPPSVKTIEDEAFRIASLTIELNDGLLRIGENAFTDVSSLNEITLPDSLESVAANAFSNRYRSIEIHASERVLKMLDLSDGKE